MENNNLENQNVQPVEPVTPVAPEAPVAPVEPIAPVTPEAPAPVEPMMQTPIEPVQPVVQEEKKKKSIIPIIIIIAFIVIAGGGAAVYFLFFAKVTGKQVVDATVGNLFNKAIAAGDTIQNRFVIDYKNDIVDAKANLKVDFEMKEGTDTLAYKNVVLTLDSKVNLKDLEGSLKFATSQDNKKIADIDAFIKGKKAYVNSSLFENPYMLDMTDAFDWNEVEQAIKDMPDYKSDGYKTLAKKTVTMIQNTIKDEYVTQTEGNFTIDGKSISGLKNTLTIDAAKKKAMTKDFFTAAKNDEDYIKLLADYSGQTVEEVKKSIDEELENNEKADYTKEDDIIISIYTTSKGKFLAFEYSFGSNTGTGVSENNVTTVKIKEKNEEVYKFTYNETDKEIVFDYDGYTYKVQFIKNGIKLDVSKDDFSVVVSFTDETKDSSVVSTLDAKLNYVEGKDYIKGALNFSSELSKVDSIDTFSTSNAKAYENMTEDEYNAIMTKFGEAAKGTYLEALYTLFTPKSVYNDYSTYDYDDLDY